MPDLYFYNKLCFITYTEQENFMSEQNITELLHPAFLARMKEMLGKEYDSFIKSYKVPRTYGLRVNTAKISCEEFEKLVPFPVTPIPWIPNG